MNHEKYRGSSRTQDLDRGVTATEPDLARITCEGAEIATCTFADGGVVLVVQSAQNTCMVHLTPNQAAALARAPGGAQ